MGVDKADLAAKVVDLARAQVLSKNHFLSTAVGRLDIEPAVLGEQFVTDAYKLYFDPSRVISAFREEGRPPEHDLLHSVVHCLFLHPFVGPSVKRRFWDLACDIVAERVTADLIGARKGARGAQLAALVGRVEGVCKGRVSAESIYARFCEGEWDDEFDAWASLAHSDDHTAWYEYCGSDGSGQGDLSGGEGDPGSFRIDSGESSVSGDSRDASDGVSGEGNGDSRNAAGEGCGASSEGAASSDGAGESDPGSAHGGMGVLAGNDSETLGLSREGLRMRRLLRPNAQEQMESWRQVAVSLAVSLQTMASHEGLAASGFLEDLGRISERRVDYEDFLRQFATFGEVMRLSDDEFDGIFYTYGMKVYGNIPLIEPLEYREEKRVREFVIVIDTSGSVSGDIVRSFAETTFSILRSTESFFEKVHLRIIQCDARVQSDDRIDSPDELARWSSEVKVYGCGGTDFRPAFAYVDALVEGGEFANLGGLVYFTDGQGIYPDWMPVYKTAFVLYGDVCSFDRVPPWAIQMVLDPESFDGEAPGSIRGVVR